MSVSSGSFGEVKQALWVPHNLEVAVKIITKKVVKGKEQIVYDEMEVLRELDHKNIGWSYQNLIRIPSFHLSSSYTPFSFCILTVSFVGSQVLREN